MRVLIVKTSSMGDVIHSFPAVEDARRNRPDVSFDWCVEEAFAGIVALHPAIATIHTVAIRRWRTSPLGPSTWREAAGLRRALRECRYDLVIDAQGLLKSAVVAKQAAAPIAGFDRSSAREPSATLFYDREQAVAEAIAQAVPQTVLVPKSPLAEIAAIIGRSALIIGADTGLTHLASAFGLPTVAVFVATEPGLTGPRGPFSSTLLAAPGARVAPIEVVAEAERLLALKSQAAT
ncbi:MAG: lipopolysaccharide heptosyltransferase I [Mesorhizobium sp.]|nr:MAG: lipopolysaccharide heptosyltransferase I [Mesorhizobium sp.]